MRLPGMGLGSGAFALFVLSGGCSEVSAADDVADGDGARVSEAAALDASIPIQNISIGSSYLEIDDLDATSSRDANLCSSSAATAGDYAGNAVAACPSNGAYSLADNPNLPAGGAEPDYLDWADLDEAKHVAPFDDQDVLLGTNSDDIFSPDSCYKDTGSSPSKANLTINAFAANSEYMYLMSKRDTSNGNEGHHYYFTKTVPEFAPIPGACKGADTWNWTLEDGDIEVTLLFQSTAALAQAEVVVRRWEGGTVSDIKAEDLVQDPLGGWSDPIEGVVTAALNINGADRRAVSGEDNERFFDGSVLASTIIAELAVDLSVFGGTGCGLERTVAMLSSSSSGTNDDIKDFVSPVTIVTGELSAEVTLAESCDEELAYTVSVELDTLGGSVDVTEDPDLDVDLIVDCGRASDPVTIAEPDLPSGTIAVDVADPTNCSVEVAVSGESGGDFEACEASDEGDGDIYPIVGVSGALDPDCEGNVAYDGTVSSAGSGDYDLLWTFDVGGASSTSEDADGTLVVAAAAGSAAVAVDATISISDNQERDTDGDGVADTACDAVVYDVTAVTSASPLLVTANPTTADGTCEPDGNANVTSVGFGVSVKGGSGSYIIDWTLGDDADLDATCEALETAGAEAADADVVDADQDYATSCSFGIGSDFCANGSVALQVTDLNPECDPAGDSLSAERTSSLNVTPDL